VQASRNHPIDCGTAAGSFERANPKQTIAQRSVNVSVITELEPLVSTGTTSTTLGDTNYILTAAELSGTNKVLVIDSVPEKVNRVKSTSSSDPSVLSVSASDPNLFEYQSSGRCVLSVEMQDGETILKPVESRLFANATASQRQEFIEGTLARHLSDQLDLYANDSTQEPEHYAQYSVFDTANNQYTRNPQHWLSALDFSGTMVNKVGSAGVTRVTAITPHHAIGATHYGPQVNDVIYFLDQNNQLVSRTVSARADVGGGTDCCIVRFSQALPSSVKTYRTLPQDFIDYAPLNHQEQITDNFLRCFGWSVVFTSHYRWDAGWPLQRAGRFSYAYKFRELVYQPVLTEGRVEKYTSVCYPDRERANYNGQGSGIGGGDSGGPAFFIINGEPVLILCFVGIGGGPLHFSFLSSIQTALDALGPGGQTYETVDLSSFTNFAS
jgi:hypothetical protein